MTRVPVAVVGAGVSGLALARELAAGHVDHLLLEARDRAGGVVRSSRVEGRVLEHGPQRMRLTPPIAELVRGLGLEEEIVRVPDDLPLWVYRRGALRRVPFTPRELVRTDLLRPAAKLRLLLEPLTAPPRDGETVGAFLRRKLGDEAYEAVAGPLFGGLFGSDPEEMYVRHSLAATLVRPGAPRSLLLRFLRAARSDRPPAVSFRDGLGTLMEGLGRSAGPRLRLRTPVRGIRAAAPADEPGGWIVQTDGDVVRARAVVVAVPAAEAARLLKNVAPDAARRIGGLRYNPLALVHLVGECPVRGLGYQVARGEGFRTRGVTWNSAALGRKDLQTAFLGGADDPGIADLPDDEVGEIARRESRAITGCDTRAIRVVRTAMPAWDRSWTALDGLRLPPGLHLCANWESRPGLPGRFARATRLADELRAAPGVRDGAGRPPPAD